MAPDSTEPLETKEAGSSRRDTISETPKSVDGETPPTEAKPATTADITNEFPDGGLLAWSAVVGGFFAQ